MPVQAVRKAHSATQYMYYIQWLKCNGTQGNAVPPPPIYGSKRAPTSDCYNAWERHTTIVRAQTWM